MADAYDVMNMAKRYGAAARNLEAWEDYQDDLRSFQEKKGKGSFWGGLAQMGMAAAMPLLVPATGGTILSMLGKGLLRGGATDLISKAVGGIAEGNNPMAKFKGGGGFYGIGQRKELERKARDIKKDLDSASAASDRNRMFGSILSGFLPELKGGSGSKWAEKFKEIGGNISEIPNKIGNLKNVKGNKQMMELISSESKMFPSGGSTDLQNTLDNILQEGLSKGSPDINIAGKASDVGSSFGTPSQYQGASNIVSPLEVSERASLPYEIKPPEIPLTKSMPYSAASFKIPTANTGLDTMSILEGIGSQYEAPLMDMGTTEFNPFSGYSNPFIDLLLQMGKGGK